MKKYLLVFLLLPFLAYGQGGFFDDFDFVKDLLSDGGVFSEIFKVLKSVNYWLVLSIVFLSEGIKDRLEKMTGKTVDWFLKYKAWLVFVTGLLVSGIFFILSFEKDGGVLAGSYSAAIVGYTHIVKYAKPAFLNLLKGFFGNIGK